VIVHGAWGAGYEWKEVGGRLRAEGFDVYRPTLTGMGERSHLSSPDIDLETHIMDVVNTILFESLRDVTLVAHSYGGVVATGVADRVPDRIKKVVYVDAFLPENGESANTSIGIRERPEPGGFVPPMWKVTPGPPPHAMPQPAKTFSQPLVLKNQEAALKAPTTYILTVDPGRAPEQDMFFRFSERARARGWKIFTMEADHVPQWSRVPEIVGLLAQEADQSGKHQ
jgi:pimeloyl-ACP methyl ester carboxylesterase